VSSYKHEDMLLMAVRTSLIPRSGRGLKGRTPFFQRYCVPAQSLHEAPLMKPRASALTFAAALLRAFPMLGPRARLAAIDWHCYCVAGRNVLCRLLALNDGGPQCSVLTTIPRVTTSFPTAQHRARSRRRATARQAWRAGASGAAPVQHRPHRKASARNGQPKRGWSSRRSGRCRGRP
jgi:hypothetical protein